MVVVDITNQPEEQQHGGDAAEGTVTATATGGAATPATPAEPKILNNTIVQGGVRMRPLVPRSNVDIRNLCHGRGCVDLRERSCRCDDGGDVDALTLGLRGLKVEPGMGRIAEQLQGLNLNRGEEDSSDDEGTTVRGDRKDGVKLIPRGPPGVPVPHATSHLSASPQMTHTGARKRGSSQVDPCSKGFKPEEQGAFGAQGFGGLQGFNGAPGPIHTSGGSVRSAGITTEKPNTIRRISEQKEDQQEFARQQQPQQQMMFPQQQPNHFPDAELNFSQFLSNTNDFNIPPTTSQQFGCESEDKFQAILNELLEGESNEAMQGQGGQGLMYPSGNFVHIPHQQHYLTQLGALPDVPSTNSHPNQMVAPMPDGTNPAQSAQTTPDSMTGSNTTAILRDRKFSDPKTPESGYNTGESMVASPGSVDSDATAMTSSSREGSRPSSGEEKGIDDVEFEIIQEFINEKLEEEKKQKEKQSNIQVSTNGQGHSVGVSLPSHGTTQPGPPIVIPQTVPQLVCAQPVPQVVFAPQGVVPQFVYRWPVNPPPSSQRAVLSTSAATKPCGRPPYKPVVQTVQTRRILPKPPGGVPPQPVVAPPQSPASRRKSGPSKGNTETTARTTAKPVPIAPAPVEPKEQPSPQRDERVVVLPNESTKKQSEGLIDKQDLSDMLEPDSEGDLWLHRYIVHLDNDGNAIYMINAIIQRLKREHLRHAINIEVEINRQNNLYQTPVYLATVVNNQWVLDWLLKAGGDPNIEGSSTTPAGPVHKAPLHFAAARGDEYLDVLYVLLESRKTDLNKRNSDGLRPLHVAVASHGKPIPKTGGCIDSTRVILALIQKGANLEEKDERTGKTPIHFLVETHSFTLIRDVFSVIPDPNLKRLLQIQTSAGNTPLHTAAQCAMANVDNHKQIVKLLLEKGSDIGVKNSENQTAQAVVYKPHREELTPLLKAHGKQAAHQHHNNSNAPSPQALQQHNPKSPRGGKHVFTAPNNNQNGGKQILTQNAVPVTNVLVYTLPSTVPIGQGQTVMAAPIITCGTTVAGTVQVTQAPRGFPAQGSPLGSPLMAVGSPGMPQASQGEYPGGALVPGATTLGPSSPLQTNIVYSPQNNTGKQMY